MKSLSKNFDNTLRVLAMSTLLILISTKGWLQESYDLNLSLTIYFTIFFLFFFFQEEIYLYLLHKFRANFYSLDFLIIFFLLLHIIINQSISTHALSFGIFFIFFSAITFSNKKQNIEIMLISLLIAGIISLGGVIVGFLEGLIGTSTKFINVEPQNYPSPMIKVFNYIFAADWRYQISGLHISINYTAYVLIAGLAAISTLDEKRKFKKLIMIFFIFGLLLSQAKIGYLFLTFLVIKSFLSNKYFFLILISAGYLVLTHLTINNSDNTILNSHYFRSLLFSLGDYDFYLSFFSWLKISAIQYLNSSLWFFGNYDEFINIVVADPHSFWISMILIGGPITTFLILIKFIKSEKNYRVNSKNESAILFATYYSFIVESFTWDALDAPIFWIIFFIAPLIIVRKDQVSAIE